MSLQKLSLPSGTSPPKTEAEQIQDLLAAIERLARLDADYLRAHPETPGLYASGVRYEPASGDGGIPDVARCREVGKADADALVAWRCAELRERGRVDAQPYIQIIDTPRGRIYTCVVRHPDGSTENVVAILRAGK